MLDHDNLEEFQDPVNYDLEEAPGSAERIAFYCRLAAQIGGPLLEIACGTGIVTLPLAAQGLQVSGVDLAQPMLDHARHKAERQGLHIRLVAADARNFELGAAFQMILMTGNAFQAFLERKDQEQLLASVRRHLAPGGRFVFETRNPSGHDLSNQLEEVPWHSYRNNQGHQVTVSGTQHYDPLGQIMHWTTYRRWHDAGEPQTRVTRIACRFTYPQELEALLHYNGFALETRYGNWDHSPLGAASPSMICICRMENGE